MNLNSCLLVNTILVEDKSKRKVASLLMWYNLYKINMNYIDYIIVII